MQAERLLYLAELRRRWKSWLALGLLVAVIGGAVLAATAAGRQTSSAFPRFLQKYGMDAETFSPKPIPQLTSLPEVAFTERQPSYFNGNATVGHQTIPQADVSLAGIPAHERRPLFKLLSGRMPSAPDEALASFLLAQQYGVHIGSVIKVPLFLPSQLNQALFSSSVRPLGPTATLHVVGFEVDINDFPYSNPSYSILVGPAFARQYRGRLIAFTATYVWLRHGSADEAAFAAQQGKLPGEIYTSVLGPATAGVERSIHPQAVGWWLLALLVGLGGLAVVGQALARQSLVESESFPTLRALGVRPLQLLRLGLARTVTVGVIGALGGVGLAWALSPLTPVGEARAAEPIQGFSFDSLVLPLGALAVVLVTGMLGALSAWRAAKSSFSATITDPASARPMALFGRFRRVGGAPTALVGTRRALERGRGRSAVPVVTALLGAGLAVTALVATAVFGASLTKLTRTPRLYGRDAQLSLTQGGLTGHQALSFVSAVERYPGVNRVSYGLNGLFVDIRNTAVQALLVRVPRGPGLLSTVTGRLPSGPGEVALGTTTLRQFGAKVGSSISVGVDGPDGQRAALMRVVGTAVFPTDLGTGGLGVGAIITVGGAVDLACGPDGLHSACGHRALSHLEQQSFWGVLVGVSQGPAGRRALAALKVRFASYVSLASPPTFLANFGEAVNFPLLLGIALALFGAATFTHLIIVSVLRRRRDVALLKALGFVRRQIVSTVCWQASIVALAAVGIGTPLGIALGRVVWRAFAFNLGVVPLDVVPGLLVAGLAAGMLAGANLLALLPAVAAARLRPAVALREP